MKISTRPEIDCVTNQKPAMNTNAEEPWVVIGQISLKKNRSRGNNNSYNTFNQSHAISEWFLPAHPSIFDLILRFRNPSNDGTFFFKHWLTLCVWKWLLAAFRPLLHQDKLFNRLIIRTVDNSKVSWFHCSTLDFQKGPTILTSIFFLQRPWALRVT